MRKMTQKTKRIMLPVLAFFTPVFLYLGVMLAARIAPFGDNTLLLWDANYQYTAFMAYWQRVLGGQADALYSFGRALGGNMAGMLAYYLLSPANVLLLLPLSFPLVYSLLVLVKIGLCGLTFLLFLRTREWKGLLFSTAYALCGFMAAYFFHVIWLDAVILLPLVALGIWRIHEGRGPVLYILSLGAALLLQYYFGYMLCAFSALFFLFYLPQWRWKLVLRFALASLLAAGLAAAVLIPVYFTVAQGYSLFGGGLMTLDRVNTLEHLLTKVYTASISTVQLRGNSPNIYVGIPMLALIALYLLNGNIPLAKRLRSLGLAAALGVSFWIAAPYYAWHAFDTPNFFPARFSFLFSFVLISMGYDGLCAPGKPKKRLILLAAGFAAVSFLLFRTLTVEYLAYKTIVADVIVFVAACGLLMLRKWRKTVILLLCLMQFAGLFANAYYAYARLSTIYTATENAYLQETETAQAQIDRVLSGDDSLYRMEKDFSRNDNDPLLYGYRGLSHMSSDIDRAFLNFCTRIGLDQGNNHLAYRTGAGPVLDSLLGVKYILRRDGVAFGPLPAGYGELWRDGDVTAYENAFALPFAYLAPEQTRELTDGNPFVNQNTLLSDLTGSETAVFEPVYDIGREYDGTWETYTFPVEADRPLYMKSFGTDYYLNGFEESADRMNGSILLPAANADTAYELRMTYPLGIALAYFDWEAFRSAQAVLAAHAAQAESDTDSHLVIYADVRDSFTQLLITVPYDAGWRVWVDGERAETTARYGALLAVNLTTGEHTVELRFVPQGLWAGVAVSAASLALVILWMVWRRRKQEKTKPDRA